MTRLCKVVATAVVLVPFVAVAAVLLFWLGRSEEEQRSEMVVSDEDLDGEST